MVRSLAPDSGDQKERDRQDFHGIAFGSNYWRVGFRPRFSREGLESLGGPHLAGDFSIGEALTSHLR